MEFGLLIGYTDLFYIQRMTALHNSLLYAHRLVSTVTSSLPLRFRGFQASNSWRFLSSAFTTVSVAQLQQIQQPHSFLFLLEISFGQLQVSYYGRPLWPEDGSVIYSYRWASQAQSLLVPRSAGLTTTFYSLKFDIPPIGMARLFIREQGSPETSTGPCDKVSVRNQHKCVPWCSIQLLSWSIAKKHVLYWAVTQ
jgi:hypothetical protein